METDCGERRFEGDKETREEDEDEGKKEEGRSRVFGSRCIKQGLVVCCTLLVRN
jgi:hypothetical protein